MEDLREGKRLRKDTIDIANQRFGKLLAIEPNLRSKRRGVEWLCRCDCGDTCYAYGGHLRDGSRKSCGCMASDHIRKSGVNMIFHNYEIKAKKRKIEFQLTKERFDKLIGGDCFYCGVEPSQIRKKSGSAHKPHITNKVQIVWNGVDRLDSNKDYTEDNCVSCCKWCNQAKSTLTLDEFKAHVGRICKWLKINS